MLKVPTLFTTMPNLLAVILFCRNEYQSPLSLCSRVLCSKSQAMSNVTVSVCNFASLVLSKQMDKLFTKRSPAPVSGRSRKFVWP